MTSAASGAVDGDALSSRPPGAAAGALDSSTATDEVLGSVFARQKEAFARHGAPSLEERRDSLANLAMLVDDDRALIIEAAELDFGGRDAFETELSEVIGTTSTIRYLRRNLCSWMKPTRRSTSVWFKPARNRVDRSPLGVVGVFAPWNFTVQLGLIPAATAWQRATG